MIYGALPEDLGLVDIAPTEMLFWMYCPIATPRTRLVIPQNLEQFLPIISEAVMHESVRGDGLEGKYVYITAKTLWVAGDYIGNRPGWHSDGFGTDDVNYIWSDRAPTEFLHDAFQLPPDCTNAMQIMEQRAGMAQSRHIRTYPDKHLLRLTPAVIHRSPVGFAPGMRTFVKVSISRDRYNLLGNSINHELGESWDLVPREPVRNHPHKGACVDRG